MSKKVCGNLKTDRKAQRAAKGRLRERGRRTRARERPQRQRTREAPGAVRGLGVPTGRGCGVPKRGEGKTQQSAQTQCGEKYHSGFKEKILKHYLKKKTIQLQRR